MGIVFNILTYVLVVIVLALLIARVRGQQQLRDAVAGLEHSRHRFGESLAMLAVVANNVDYQHLPPDTELSYPPHVGVGHGELRAIYGYSVPTPWWWVDQSQGTMSMIYPNTSGRHIHHGVSHDEAWGYGWLEEDAVEYEVAS